MREVQLPIPELGLIAGTRAAAGFGLGLLLADRFSDEQRKAIGWALFLTGLLSTLPIAMDVFGHRMQLPQAS
jgi:hypothetical protein